MFMLNIQGVPYWSEFFIYIIVFRRLKYIKNTIPHTLTFLSRSRRLFNKFLWTFLYDMNSHFFMYSYLLNTRIRWQIEKILNAHIPVGYIYSHRPMASNFPVYSHIQPMRTEEFRLITLQLNTATHSSRYLQVSHCSSAANG